MIHATAVIDPKAEVDEGATIGPFAVIEAGVKIAAGTKLGPYVHIQGLTEIGPDNEIGAGCTLGLPPQHTGYCGAPTRLVIGRGNILREYVSFHRAFEEGAATTIGDEGFFMDFTHVGHDCRLGDRVTMTNGVLLAGHVTVGDGAIFGGVSGVHQFCRIGRLAMIGGMSPVRFDVPPFMMAQGSKVKIRALNSIGLRRAGIGPESRKQLKDVFRKIYRSGLTMSKAVASIDTGELGAEATELVEWFRADSKRGVTPGSASS